MNEPPASELPEQWPEQWPMQWPAPGDGDHVIVFARVPRLGQVKTRLAATLGEPAALAAYRELLSSTLAAVSQALERGATTGWLCLTGADVEGECAALARQHGLRMVRQIAGVLGIRMAAALRACMAQGGRAVLIGCDIPPIDAGVLHCAFGALDRHDLVFGPTEDGGYALVGARVACAPVFEGIVWSTDRVMAQTRERVLSAGLSAFELPMLWDVDEQADWLRWQAWQADR